MHEEGGDIMKERRRNEWSLLKIFQLGR